MVVFSIEVPRVWCGVLRQEFGNCKGVEKADRDSSLDVSLGSCSSAIATNFEVALSAVERSFSKSARNCSGSERLNARSASGETSAIRYASVFSIGFSDSGVVAVVLETGAGVGAVTGMEEAFFFRRVLTLGGSAWISMRPALREFAVSLGFGIRDELATCATGSLGTGTLFSPLLVGFRTRLELEVGLEPGFSEILAFS